MEKSWNCVFEFLWESGDPDRVQTVWKCSQQMTSLETLSLLQHSL